MVNEVALGIAIMLFTGLVFGKLAKFARVPDVTGYLIGGLLIGPAIAKLIGGFFDISSANGILNESIIKALRLIIDIELGFIAFTVGSEFKVSYIKQVGAMPVVVAFLESFFAVLFTSVGIFAITFALGVPLYFAIALGAVSGATAPAATIMVLNQYKAKGPLSKTIMSVVAIDDASALIYFGIAMAIVKAMLTSNSNIALSIIMPFIEIIASVAMGIICGFAITFLVRFFKKSGNRLVLSIAFIMLIIGVFNWINGLLSTSFSALLACMTMGMVYCNTSKTVDDMMPLINTITPPFVVIFFVMSGATLELGALTLMAALLIVLYMGLRTAGKFFGVWAGSKLCRMDPTAKKYLGFALLPQGGIAIGLSQIVFGILPTDATYNGALFVAIILCAVFISEIFGPILCKFAIMKSGEGTDEDAKPKKKKNTPTSASETPLGE